MNVNRFSACLMLLALAAAVRSAAAQEALPNALSSDAQGVLSDTQGLALKPVLGGRIFFDNNLSINRNQSCAACHGPRVGWTGPDQEINVQGAVYEGSVDGLFGNRKPPSSAYATSSPVFYFDQGLAEFVGGNFWDGRATGEKLGNPAADQAQGPFLNPVEQALPDAACVVGRVCAARYSRLYRSVWGGETCDVSWPDNLNSVCAQRTGTVSLSEQDRTKVDQAFNNIALSIAAFEDSRAVNSFSSKFDASLAGRSRLTRQERQGLELFRGKANCNQCHALTPAPIAGRRSVDTQDKRRPPTSPLFTDFTFVNIGTPKNPGNPFYDMAPEINPAGKNFIDLGLGGFLRSRPEWEALAPQNDGKMKVPTLRNVDKRPFRGFVKAYGHNGFFKSLKQIVHFYNTRDVLARCPEGFTGVPGASCWPAPEVSANLETEFVGNLGLDDAEEDAIVAFLRTLSDGFDQ